MTVNPNNWVEEDRDEFVSTIIDNMISTMTFEELRNTVWDMLYDGLIWQEWSDLWMHAEDYAPELLERFEDRTEEETSL